MIDPPSATSFSAHAYAPAWRGVTALLVAVSRGSLPLLLLLVVLATDPPIGPIMLGQLVGVFGLLPGLAARLLQRACAARVARHGADLVLQRRDVLVEIPCGAIASIAPWIVPLPGIGLGLRMRSGNRLRYGLELADPTPLLQALAASEAGDAARAAQRHPSVIYAHAAAGVPPWRWYHYAWKFALFALAPTAVLFNAHQHIAYGGPLGEYYLLGPAAYLQTFALYWVTVAIDLVLFAAVWRGAAEVAALAAAWAAPAQAARARRIAEVVCQALYYGGVPALLAARFLA